MALHYTETSLPVVNLLWAGWIFGLSAEAEGPAGVSKLIWASVFGALALTQIWAIVRDVRTGRRLTLGFNLVVWALWCVGFVTHDVASPAIPLTVFVIYLATVAYMFADRLSHRHNGVR